MKYDCLIIDDEKLFADSTAEYFNLFGVKTAASYGVSGCLDFLGGEYCRPAFAGYKLGRRERL